MMTERLCGACLIWAEEFTIKHGAVTCSDCGSDVEIGTRNV